jgi:hypothetical protein
MRATITMGLERKAPRPRLGAGKAGIAVVCGGYIMRIPIMANFGKTVNVEAALQ